MRFNESTVAPSPPPPLRPAHFMGCRTWMVLETSTTDKTNLDGHLSTSNTDSSGGRILTQICLEKSWSQTEFYQQDRWLSSPNFYHNIRHQVTSNIPISSVCAIQGRHLTLNIKFIFMRYLNVCACIDHLRQQDSSWIPMFIYIAFLLCR